MKKLKIIEWVASAKRDLSDLPEVVEDEIGYSLYRAQEGKMSRAAKPMKGLGTGVMEIVADYDTDTYRAVYVVNLDDKVHVLHCFQKKSKHGIKTPKEEINLIKERLKWLKNKLKQQKDIS